MLKVRSDRTLFIPSGSSLREIQAPAAQHRKLKATYRKIPTCIYSCKCKKNKLQCLTVLLLHLTGDPFLLKNKKNLLKLPSYRTISFTTQALQTFPSALLWFCYLVKNSNPVSNITVNSIKLHVTFSVPLLIKALCPSSSAVPRVKKPNGNFHCGWEAPLGGSG